MECKCVCIHHIAFSSQIIIDDNIKKSIQERQMVVEKDGWIETSITFDYFLACLIILYLAHISRVERVSFYNFCQTFFMWNFLDNFFLLPTIFPPFNLCVCNRYSKFVILLLKIFKSNRIANFIQVSIIFRIFCYQSLMLMKSELDQISDLNVKEKSYFTDQRLDHTQVYDTVLKVSRAINQCKWSFTLT